MRYAMVLQSRVIDIVESSIAPSYPPNQHGYPVDAIECNTDVHLGMYYNSSTGSFTEESESEIVNVVTPDDELKNLLKTNISDIEKRAQDQTVLELMKEGLI